MSKILYPIFKLPSENEDDVEYQAIPTWIKWWLLNNYNKKHSWVLSEIITGNPLTLENSVATKFYLPPLPRGNSEQVTAILPTGYTQLDYIESSGTQYIDTGIKPNNTTKIQMKFELKETAFAIIGYTVTAVPEQYNFRVFNAENEWYLDYGSGEHGNRIHGGTFNLDTIYDIEIGNRYIKNLDTNTDIITSTQVSAFTRDYNLVLCGIRYNTTDVSAKGKFYYLKIYDNNTLVRDYIPCKRNSDSEIGLYDLVNNNFVTNSGTGTFTAGNTVTVPNPEYPIAISNVTGDVEVLVSNSDNTESQTLPLTLGSIELCKIGTAQDYFYKENSKWYLYKAISKVEYDGSNDESWASETKDNIINYKIGLSTAKGEDTTITCLSNYFIAVSGNNSYQGSQLNAIGIGGSKTLRVRGSGFETLADWETWLSTHNTEVYYELATPTFTEITDTTLIEQLDAISQALSYEEQTNISGSSDEANPLFEVQYYMKNESEGE